ncbi:MAG: peptidoglycan-binding protein [Rhodobacteraceae bacterium]|nr:peptidoglycan-binding protein [Paracoccaceae bacterium]
MKFILKVATILVVSLMAVQAKAENLALILSFQDYDNGADVRSGTSNHDALVRAYRAAGYRVFDAEDRDRRQLQRPISQFVQNISRADNAVIHITGHVIHFGNSNWLLPVDATAGSVADLEFDGVSLDFLLELLAVKPDQSVMFLGLADRNFANIAGATRGISVSNLPDGVLLISGGYRNLSRSVLNDFLDRGTPVVDALQNNIRALTVQGDIPFRLVLGNGQPVAPAVDTAEEIQQALGLNRRQRRAIQTDLTLLGFGLGSVDGVLGNATRRAVRRWQQDQRLTATGYLTRQQITLLDQLSAARRSETEYEDRSFWARSGAGGDQTGLRAYLNAYPSGLFAERARNELEAFEQNNDIDEWARAARLNTLESYERYLRRFPGGIYSRLAKVRIQERGANNEPEVNNNAQRAEEQLRLDRTSQMLIEIRLSALGYRVGTADGVFDDTTRQGIRRYQRDRNMPVTGYVSAQVIRALLLNR